MPEFAPVCSMCQLEDVCVSELVVSVCSSGICVPDYKVGGQGCVTCPSLKGMSHKQHGEKKHWLNLA